MPSGAVCFTKVDAITMQWCGDRALGVPLVADDAHSQRAVLHETSGILYPLGHRLDLAECLQLHISTGVGPLYFPCRPPAVVRRIRPIVVDPVDGQSIGVAIGDRPCAKWSILRPLVTNADPPASVTVVVAVVRVRATVVHAMPNASKLLAATASSTGEPGRLSHVVTLQGVSAKAPAAATARGRPILSARGSPRTTCSRTCVIRASPSPQRRMHDLRPDVQQLEPQAVVLAVRPWPLR